MKNFKLYFEHYLELLEEAKANTHLTHLEQLARHIDELSA